MIKVDLIHDDGCLVGLELNGHAEFAAQGKDLVCAAVSAIITGGFNAFSEDDFNELTLNEGYAKVITCSKQGQIILETIVVQLKTIANAYPKNIRLSNREVQK